jgi:hypothetical protein
VSDAPVVSASFETVRLDHRQQPWLDLARAAIEAGA